MPIFFIEEIEFIKNFEAKRDKSYPQIEINVENIEAIENFEATKTTLVPFFVFA